MKRKKLVLDVQQITAPNLWMDVMDGHLTLTDALPNDGLKITPLIEGDSVDINIGMTDYKLAGMIVRKDQDVMTTDGHQRGIVVKC